MTGDSTFTVPSKTTGQLTDKLPGRKSYGRNVFDDANYISVRLQKFVCVFNAYCCAILCIKQYQIHPILYWKYCSQHDHPRSKLLLFWTFNLQINRVLDLQPSNYACLPHRPGQHHLLLDWTSQTSRYRVCGRCILQCSRGLA